MVSNYIENCYSNKLKFIENLPNGKTKRTAIGALVCDLKTRCINTLANILKVSWRYVKKCFCEYLGLIPHMPETRGRKKATEIFPDIESDIRRIVDNDSCCDPNFKNEYLYVKLTAKEIRERLIDIGKYDESSCASIATIKRLLRKLGYKLTKVKKTVPVKKIEETDAIFKNVRERTEVCKNDPECVLISIDTKDRVAIGNYSRGGYNYNEVKAADHDFKDEYITPFGILDMKVGRPHFYSVYSKVTAECMADNIEDFLKTNYINQGKEVRKLGILSDNGPENNSLRTYYIYKLIELAKNLDMEIELIFYPPYHSKYNPIERVWARLENIWNGYLITTRNIALNFMKSLTWKGMRSTAKEIKKEYQTGLKISNKGMKLLRHNHITYINELKKWSLVIHP